MNKTIFYQLITNQLIHLKDFIMNLHRPRKGRGPRQQDSSISILYEWHNSLGGGCLDVADVVRLVYDDHLEALTEQRLLQESTGGL